MSNTNATQALTARLDWSDTTAAGADFYVVLGTSTPSPSKPTRAKLEPRLNPRYIQDGPRQSGCKMSLGPSPFGLQGQCKVLVNIGD
ncbi:hypothetical protein SCP_1303570 [Sparassis crispa]|uniref:Uncharacterized protein n=1 Tax=Sparassis crispa TaxID=139825 RepID=A0A401H283_9APHY|nr:hypothetical protein SCP_1303570 [Sparassis crispa]GBE88541.1 hypothetical protein SCP_1303570 [Sparassis crispa]